MNLLKEENLRVARNSPFFLGLERTQRVFRAAVDHLHCADWLGAPAIQLARKLLAGGGRAANQDRDVNPCGKADIFFGCQRRRRSRLCGLHQMPGTTLLHICLPSISCCGDTCAADGSTKTGQWTVGECADPSGSMSYQHEWTAWRVCLETFPSTGRRAPTCGR